MEREAEGPVAEGASLDDRMARIGQFAAAKRSIQATFDAKAREMQAQEATLGIISTRKAERDRVRAEREAAVRACFQRIFAIVRRSNRMNTITSSIFHALDDWFCG